MTGIHPLSHSESPLISMGLPFVRLHTLMVSSALVHHDNLSFKDTLGKMDGEKHVLKSNRIQEPTVGKNF